MTERAGPEHPGWALWERKRREHQERVARAVRETAALGLPPPPPFVPRPEDPGREVLDRLVEQEAEQAARARTFRYQAISWDGDRPSITAERRGPQVGAVTFDGFLSGTWIFDPKGLGEVRHQAIMEDHYTLREVSRTEAEEIAAARGLTLPGEERLLEICEQRIGAMFGASATREELAERKRLMP